jgi:predicted secreted Zn-dependent protease
MRQLLLLALSLGTAHQILAQVAVQDQVKHYAIHGTTARELAREMRNKGPTLLSGTRAFAFTHWVVDWNPRIQVADNRCSIAAAEVMVVITMTLPEWDGSHAEPKLQAHWDRFYAALVTHEQGHRQIGLEAGQAIERELMALAADRCDLLRLRASELAQSILRTHQLRNSDYDHQTSYGRKQGVKFP